MLPQLIKNPVRRRFGSLRGAARYGKYLLLMHLGAFRALSDIDFSRVSRLIFICSGNICRSPFAEFYARSRGIEAESFGLHCPDGDPADPRAIDFAKSVGIDMKGHLTRNIQGYEPESGDLVLAMEPAQYQELQTLNGSQDLNASILPLFNRKPSPYLHDPWGSPPEFFDRCERQIMEAVDRITERIDVSRP